LENISIRPNSKIGGVDDAPALFPVGADFVGIFGNFEAITDGKGRAGAFDHLFGFLQRIDGEGDNIGILFFELLDMRLEVG